LFRPGDGSDYNAGQSRQQARYATMTFKPPEPDPQVENLDPVVISEQQFDRAVRHIQGMKRGLIDFLKMPKRVSIVNFPVQLEDCSVVSTTVCSGRARAGFATTPMSPWRRSSRWPS
jgi:hypothetical protein